MIVRETDLPGLGPVRRGKVRDVYEVDDQHLLIVASDRISAFDVVMAEPVPDKGRILTQISLFWFQVCRDLTPNHLISSNPADYPAACRPYRDLLAGRSMWVKKAQALPVECIVRGYIAGSGWEDYKRTGAVCGVELPPGLRESDRLPEPIFTPSTKAELGLHDENITFAQAESIIGPEVARKLKEISLAIYRRAQERAEPQGIIIADTKFEFGLIDGEVVLIDEILTPDSSRFWPRDDYAPGRSQKSFDKQYLRDYLLSLKWNKQPPPPPLPAEVIAQTREKYLEALRRLTGAGLD